MANLLWRNVCARLVMALLYSLLYAYIYVFFLNEFYEYFGYLYNTPSLSLFISSLVYSCIPVCFYKGEGTLVSFITVLLYVLAYVPIVLTLALWGEEAYVCMLHQAVLAVAMSMFFLCERLKLRLSMNPNFQLFSFEAFEVVVWGLWAVMVYSYRNEMQFVNFLSDSELMYALRAEFAKSISGMTGYIVHWLEKAFFPLLLAGYLVRRDRVKVVAVLVAYLFLYMIRMQKITFFFPFFLLGVYWFFSRYEKLSFYMYGVFIALIFVLAFVLFGVSDTEIGFALASIFFLRTLSVAGFSYASYLDFFNAHDYTYYSHLSPVNYFTHSYPYEMELGRIMFDGMNGNAMFWPTDGIAACGLYGVAVVSVLFVLVLIVLNGLSGLMEKKYLFVLFMPIISDLLNASLFSVFSTSGLIFILIGCYLIRFPFLSKQEGSS